jgi:hypothetical protein
VAVVGSKLRLGVSGELLERAEVNPRPYAEREIGMPQCVENGVLRSDWAFHGVGNAGGGQINTKH